LICVVNAGCAIPIPYLFPHVSRTPTVSTHLLADDVKAFRVEYTYHQHGCVTFERQPADCVAMLRPKGSPPTVPSQSRLSLAVGIYLFNPALPHNFGSDGCIDVRLYRRGFETISVNGHGADGDLRSAHWKPVSDCRAREIAIDTVFVLAPAELLPVDSCPPDLVRLKCSAEAARFAAGEYEAVAGDRGISDADKRRVLQKAEHFCRLDATRE